MAATRLFFEIIERHFFRMNDEMPHNPDLAPNAEDSGALVQVPVIDLGGPAGLKDPQTIARVAGEIGEACRDWGFFQIVGHGVEPVHIARVWETVHAFFALPREDKRALGRSRENPWGYFDRELTKNRRDKKEIFDIGPQSKSGAPADDPFSGATPWPQTLPEFQRAMGAHFALCENLARAMLQAVCISLGQPANRLAACFDPRHTSFLRLNHYPVDDPLSDLPATQQDEADLGIHHHTDAGAVTVLVQDAVSGLQVYKDGLWHTVMPVDDAFVVNIGDMVQVWSNDRYRAAVHRVAAMDRVERYSIPFFFNPAYDAQVAPLAGTARYRPFGWGEFRRKRADGDYADVGREVQIADYAT